MSERLAHGAHDRILNGSELRDLYRTTARERDEWEANAEESNSVIERVSEIITEWGARPPDDDAVDLWCAVKDALGARYTDRRVCPNGCGTSWSPRSVLACPTCEPRNPDPRIVAQGERVVEMLRQAIGG